MKSWTKTLIGIGCVCLTQFAIAGKVPVVPGNSLGLSGITIPQNVTSAPSPAVPSAVSTVPTVTLPANVVTLIPGNDSVNESDSGSAGIVVQPTTQQLISVLSTSTGVESFSLSQAQTAINKISSILNNVELDVAQTAQMIELRESFETFISEAGAN
jgi:L-cystine uptake protein TcyP (sodium:dicarboxylate symporter family)